MRLKVIRANLTIAKFMKGNLILVQVIRGNLTFSQVIEVDLSILKVIKADLLFVQVIRPGQGFVKVIIKEGILISGCRTISNSFLLILIFKLKQYYNLNIQVLSNQKL